jgi:hypothetical protein
VGRGSAVHHPDRGVVHPAGRDPPQRVGLTCLRRSLRRPRLANACPAARRTSEHNGSVQEEDPGGEHQTGLRSRP